MTRFETVKELRAMLDRMGADEDAVEVIDLSADGAKRDASRRRDPRRCRCAGRCDGVGCER